MSRALRCSPLVAVACLALAGAAAADPPAESGSLGPEILHMPLLERRAEQGILRPVPIAVELPEEITLRAKRVLVHYRLWGEPDWTTIALRRNGARYEGAVPCLEISTVTGDLRYYIRVYDADNHVIASAGSLAKPYLVTIKHDTTLATDQQHAAKCPDPADCPRGLPGCPSEKVVDVPCQSDADCGGGGMTCGWRGFCERIARHKNWISFSIEQGLGVVRTAGACSVYAQENEGTACFRSDGEQYIGNPVLTNEPVGVGLAPTRLLIGFDRLVHYDTSLGVRVGIAVRGWGPTPPQGTGFVPFSIAGRVTHWFGDDPFARSRLRPFAFLTGGYAMVDVETKVHVREDPTRGDLQGGNDLEQRLDLWKRAGDGFVGAGGGVAYPIGTRVALSAEIAVLGVFPFGALVIAPSAGVMLGF